jgi:hypothetical protein
LWFSSLFYFLKYSATGESQGAEGAQKECSPPEQIGLFYVLISVPSVMTRFLDNEKHSKLLVGAMGIEPTTFGLKVKR